MYAFPKTVAFSHYPLSMTKLHFYKLVLLFIAGNIIFPLTVHLIPQGGKIFLPIYFFTLIAAYRFGLAAGLATALLSPLANHILTGMPPASVLPVLLTKSVLLAIAASWIARRTQKISLLHIAAAVLSYQLFGGIFEWIFTGNIQSALSDFRIGFPGILVQIVAGYFLLKWLNHRGG